jgi:gliding motility-associated protein GldE
MEGSTSPTLDSDSAPLFLPLILLQHAAAPLTSGFIVGGILALIVLLLLSALFSGSEVALFSLSDSSREAIAGQSDRASRRVIKLLERPRELLISILILNTLVNVATAVLAAVITASVATAQNWNPTLTLVLEVLVLTFVLLVMSEISPKLIATRHAAAFARTTSGLLTVLSGILYPISKILAKSTHLMHGRMRPGSRRLSSEDLKALADVGEAHGTLEEEERELIYSIVEFGETSVREIMVSRLDIVALPVSFTLAETLEIIRESGHSRMPLYVDHLDNILGVIYAKDLLPHLHRKEGSARLDWTRIARPAIFVPMGKKLGDLLKDFQTKKTHIAIVVDEYGGTAGLVTLEDVLEEIVGEIRDEHDETEEELYEQIDANTYRFDARINLDDINELIGIELDTEEYDFETLGGLIFHLTGSIPQEGDEIKFESLKIRVEAVDNHRIGQVLVEFGPPPELEEVSRGQREGERNAGE